MCDTSQGGQGVSRSHCPNSPKDNLSLKLGLKFFVQNLPLNSSIAELTTVKNAVSCDILVRGAVCFDTPAVSTVREADSGTVPTTAQYGGHVHPTSLVSNGTAPTAKNLTKIYNFCLEAFPILCVFKQLLQNISLTIT
jgi:hypothetical protein